MPTVEENGENYKANFEIHLPRSVNDALNSLATKRQVLKREIIRIALMEFVESHLDEIR